MIFMETKLRGVIVVVPEKQEDDRGFFSRVWCTREFAAHGLSARLVQCNVSFNAHEGTLRGMHYQAAPHEEVKLVRCTAGAFCDVVIDLRPTSPTFKQWLQVELSAASHRSLYIPAGCAHGFLTLQDNTEVLYHMSEFYHPSAGRGVRWDDPAFAIDWPAVPRIISARDRDYPDFVE